MYGKANEENCRKWLLIYLHSLIWEPGKISLLLLLLLKKKKKLFFLSIDSYIKILSIYNIIMF